MVEIGDDFIEDLEKMITDSKELTKGFLKLFIRIEDAFGRNFQDEFGEVYELQTEKMNNHVRELMNRVYAKKKERQTKG